MGKVSKMRHRVGIEAHANLVRDTGLAEAHFVGLPEGRDLSEDLPFQFFGVRSRERKTIEIFETSGRCYDACRARFGERLPSDAR